MTLNNYSYTGALHSLQPGSTEVSYDGFANPQEFGTLGSRQDQGQNELVYKAGDGTEYVFKPYDDGDGEKIYLVDRIEQPGIEKADFASGAGRRGISFGYTTSVSPPTLSSIVASDRAEITVSSSQISLAGGGRTVNLTKSGGNLTEIHHVDATYGDCRSL